MHIRSRVGDIDMAKKLIVAAALCTFACSTHPTFKNTNYEEIFSHPERFVGSYVTVCGYVNVNHHSQNIWRSEEDYPISRPGNGNGIGIDVIDLRGFGIKENSLMCIRGEMYRSGCAQEAFCTSSTFSYAIKNISVVE